MNVKDDKIERIAEDVSAIKVKVDFLVDSQKEHREIHRDLDREVEQVKTQQVKNSTKIRTLWIAMLILCSLVTGGKFAADKLLMGEVQAGNTEITQPIDQLVDP